MNHENISLQDLLDRQADLCKQIKNCKISKKQIFESKRALLHKPICKGFFSDIIFK